MQSVVATGVHLGIVGDGISRSVNALKAHSMIEKATIVLPRILGAVVAFVLLSTSEVTSQDRPATDLKFNAYGFDEAIKDQKADIPTGTELAAPLSSVERSAHLDDMELSFLDRIRVVAAKYAALYQPVLTGTERREDRLAYLEQQNQKILEVKTTAQLLALADVGSANAAQIEFVIEWMSRLE
jgi:hypothetical protein